MDSPTQALINSLSGKVEGEFVPQLIADMGVVVPSMEALLEMGDPTVLASVVSEGGLVIAPYGVGTPDQGLTGELLASILEDLLEGSRLEVMSNNSTSMDRIDMLVKGFSPVEVTPLIGDPLVMSAQAYVSWRLEPEYGWRLWLLAPDSSGLLPQAQSQVTESAGKQAASSTWGDEEVREIIAQVEALMRAADIDSLASMVRDEGLVIVPYAVGVPEKGLTGEALNEALSAILAGAQPIAVAYADGTENKLEFIMAGFNPVQVTPAVGDPLTISNPLSLTLIQKAPGSWKIWAITVDENGMLVDLIDNPPYIRLAQPEFPPEELAVIEVIDYMQAEDIDALMQLVPEDGLVIAPYGVGVPEAGLTGLALRQTLQALLTGTDLSVVASADALSPDLTGFIIEGLNPVKVHPAVGDPFMVTGYTLVALEQASEGQFLLGSLAIDVHGLMAEALAYPPFTENPTLLSDKQARAIVSDLEKSLQTGNVDALADMVNYRGLIVGPYGVGLPNRGLIDEALTAALEAMLKGAQPHVVGYQFSIGGLSIVVADLNPVQIDPAHGDPLTISSPALLELTQDKDGSWILWAVISDHSGELEAMLARTPYWSWKEKGS